MTALPKAAAKNASKIWSNATLTSGVVLFQTCTTRIGWIQLSRANASFPPCWAMFEAFGECLGT